MLAYLFWHEPRDGAERREYERRLVEFHEAIRSAVVASATFRLDQLPFTGSGGYEDWYLVEDWPSLGELNAAAVSGARAAPHDATASLAGAGWGGVYRLVRGRGTTPDGGRWASKDPDETYEAFFQGEKAEAVWQRQLVLGPAAEFFLSAEPSDRRVRVWPR